MLLHLQQLIAAHIGADAATSSEVWGKELRIEGETRILVQAPSGRGKSTLINLLYGMPCAHTGAVSWDGKDAGSMTDEALSEWRRTKLSIVFQDMRLHPALTARENIELKRGQTNTVPATTANEWAGHLGMHHKLDAITSTLSFGERQRVAIVRALCQPYRWLLMDEPFSHLDEDNARKAAEIINSRTSELRAGMLHTDLGACQLFSYHQTLQM